MKEIKVVIGANYGDEGKGLMSRHFCLDAKQKNMNPIVIMSNGTAQRGHTVDYSDDFHHVYHHFGSGTADGIPTFYSNDFLLHPMEFVREYKELAAAGITPIVYCDPKAKVITPFDMLVDHATEAHIARLKGEREYGSCGFGSWCATDRFKHLVYTIEDFMNPRIVPILMNNVWSACIAQLIERKVDVEQLPEFAHYFEVNSPTKVNAIRHFEDDLRFFITHVTDWVSYDKVYDLFDYNVFENGQGLGLDQNVDNEWHTTSNTGVLNAYELLKDKKGFTAEACYVSRSYLTRHGEGPLEEAVKKSKINEDMVDKTNVPNEFQGSLRYGYLEDKDQKNRIEKDSSIIVSDNRFVTSMCITHCNEFADIKGNSKYFSDSKFIVKERI